MTFAPGNKFGLRHGGSDTRLYRIWAMMRDRCSNPNAENFRLYGGRGISVCDQWRTFPPFAEWAEGAGYAPDLTLDRIDSGGNYEPDNCRWADRFQQARNTSRVKLSEEAVRAIRASIRGRRELATEYGVTPRQISRVRAGTTWANVSETAQ